MNRYEVLMDHEDTDINDGNWEETSDKQEDIPMAEQILITIYKILHIAFRESYKIIRNFFLGNSVKSGSANNSEGNKGPKVNKNKTKKNIRKNIVVASKKTKETIPEPKEEGKISESVIITYEDKSKEKILVSVKLENIKKKVLSGPIDVASPYLKVENQEGVNTATQRIGEHELYIVCTHGVNTNDGRIWKQLNPHVAVSGEVELAFKGKNRSLMNIEGDVMITTDKENNMKMLKIRLIKNIPGKVRSVIERVGVVIEVPLYDELIYSGSIVVIGNRSYNLISGIIDTRKNMMVALAVAIMSNKCEISFTKVEEEQESELEYADEENVINMESNKQGQELNTVSNMSISQEASLMRKVFPLDKYVTIYNLSSAPKSYVISLVHEKIKGPKDRNYNFGVLGPNKKSLVRAVVDESTYGASVIVGDKDDRDIYQKATTLTAGVNRNATLLLIELQVPGDFSTSSTLVVEACDNHAPAEKVRQMSLPHFNKIQTSLSGGLLIYNRFKAGWSSGTAGIIAYCNENEITIRVVNVGTDNKRVWIMMGSKIKKMNIKRIDSMASLDTAPNGDLEYKYRAGATDMLETYKGPVHFDDIYESKPNIVLSIGILGYVINKIKQLIGNMRKLCGSLFERIL